MIDHKGIVPGDFEPLVNKPSSQAGLATWTGAQW